MASYLVTGVARDIGYDLLSKLSSSPERIVIGLARNQEVTKDEITRELGTRHNIHILQADMADHESVLRAAKETDTITGGSLDHIIANAGVMSPAEIFADIGESADNPKVFKEALAYTMSTKQRLLVHFTRAPYT